MDNHNPSSRRKHAGPHRAGQRPISATIVADIVDAKLRSAVRRMLRQLGYDPTDALVSEFEAWRLSQDLNRFIEQKNKNFDNIKSRFMDQPISLPNAKVGENYHAEARLDIASIDELRDVGVDGLQESGLTATLADGLLVVSGVPSRAGDFRLTLRGVVATLRGDVAVERTVALLVTPDPRSLWRDIPTDPNITFFKPDLACDFKTVLAQSDVPQKDMVAASRRGRSHAHEGRPRDDHFRLDYLHDSGWYLMAVADGAGSAKYSREGSRLACNAAIDYLASKLGSNGELEVAITAYAESRKNPEGDKENARSTVSQLMSHLIAQAAYGGRRAIDKVVAANEDYSLRDFSTTLLLAIAKRFDFGWVVATFWVGDGAIALYAHDADGQSRVTLLGTPDGGEYAGQTRFLTMDDIFRDTQTLYSQRIKFTIVNDFEALLLMTDGVSDAWFDSDASLARPEAWDKLWRDITATVRLEDDREEAKEELLEWLNFWSKGNHDDRTIAILY